MDHPPLQRASTPSVLHPAPAQPSSADPGQGSNPLSRTHFFHQISDPSRASPANWPLHGPPATAPAATSACFCKPGRQRCRATAVRLPPPAVTAVCGLRPLPRTCLGCGLRPEARPRQVRGPDAVAALQAGCVRGTQPPPTKPTRR